jgi:hypothetical protein
MVKQIILCSVWYFLLMSYMALGQDIPALKLQEDTLVILSNKVWKAKNDSSRLATNSVLRNKLREVLSIRESYNYNFNALSGISMLKPDDNKFRITTWNIPLDDGGYSYYGFIEVKDKGIFDLLVDPSVRSAGWQNNVLPPDHWYGAIYYSLIHSRFKNKDYYVLLGWDGKDQSSDQKIIESLTFDDNSTPKLGSPIFKTAEGIRNRVVIEYIEKGNAVLKYDEQFLLEKKGRGIRKTKTWMIIMDRLIPLSPSFLGVRKFYVPSGDTYDAYLFRDGFWIFVEDVEVVNLPLVPKPKQAN